MTWQLPEGWRWTAVGDCLTRARSQVRHDAIKGDWLYIGLEHVQSATGEYSGVGAGEAGLKSAKFLFAPGDVLYGKLRPNLRKCVVAKETGVCSTDLVPLRPVDPAAAHFLAMQLRSEVFTTGVMRLIGGANLPRVNMRDLLGLSLPEPPDADKARLYELARSMVSLRQRQREVVFAVESAEASATAHILGLAPHGESGAVELSVEGARPPQVDVSGRLFR